MNKEDSESVQQHAWHQAYIGVNLLGCAIPTDVEVTLDVVHIMAFSPGAQQLGALRYCTNSA